MDCKDSKKRTGELKLCLLELSRAFVLIILTFLKKLVYTSKDLGAKRN